MKNRLLAAIALCAATSSNIPLWAAVNVDKPEVAKFVDFDENNGGDYYIYNLGAKMFLTAGNAYGTQASLGTSAYKVKVRQTTDAASSLSGWTIEFPKDAPSSNGGKPNYLFVAAGRTDAYIDYNLNGTYLWKIVKTEDSKYRISVIDEAPEHGSNELGYKTYMGQMNVDINYEGLDNTIVQPMLNPDVYDLEQQKKILLDWAFVSPEEYDVYSAKKVLYSVLERASENNYTETKSFEDLYNKADVTSEDLLKASEELTKLIDSFLYDNVTEENPLDLTNMIVNPSFVDSEGNRTTNGWDRYKMYIDQNREGIDYYGVEGSDRVIDDFVDAWVSPSSGIYSCGVWQYVKNLPAGKYSLSADFIASQVADPTIESKGIYIVGDGGMGESTEEVKMANFSGKGVTATVEFNVAEGANVMIGARAANSNVNWMIVDNFRLVYYGRKTEIDMAKEDLSKAIAHAEDLYNVEIVENGKACSNIGLERFNNILNLSKDGYLNTEIDKDSVMALRSALLKQCDRFVYDMNLYNGEDFSNKIAVLYAKINDNPIYSDDEFFFVKSENFILETETAYGELNFDPEEFTKLDAIADSLYKEDIMDALLSGVTNNATGLAANPNFDGNSSKGWSGGPSVSWNVAEAYNKTFNIYQTLKNLPQGSYKIKANGAYRPGSNDVCVAVGPDDPVNRIASFIYGNDAMYPMKHWYSEAFDTPPLTDEEGQPSGCIQLSSPIEEWNGKFVPNGTNSRECWDKIFADYPDAYLNEVVCYVGADGVLTFGVKSVGQHPGSANCTAFDNFRIEYLGADDLSGMKNSVESVIKKVDEVLTNNSIAGVEDPLNMPSLPLNIEMEIASAKDKANSEILASDDFTLEMAVGHVNKLNEMLSLADSALNRSTLLVNEYKFALENSLLIESDYTGYIDCMYAYEEIAQSGFESIDDVNIWIEKFKTEYTKMAIYGKTETVSKDSPADLTSAIVNPGFEKVDPSSGEVQNTYSGWNAQGQAPYISNSFVEFWQQNYDLSQDIYGLPSGYYKLTFNGFYRYGGPTEDAVRYRDKLDSSKSFVYAKGAKVLYAIPVMSISAGAVDDPLTSSYFNIGDSLYTGDDIENAPAKYTPGHKTDARVAFDAGHYINELYFKIDSEQKFVTIGMRNDDYIPNDWTIIDSFKLTYYGDGDDNMPDNIDNVSESDLVVIGSVYYNLSGQEIPKPKRKGIYFREDRMSDGTKRVLKIMVN